MEAHCTKGTQKRKKQNLLEVTVMNKQFRGMWLVCFIFAPFYRRNRQTGGLRREVFPGGNMPEKCCGQDDPANGK